MSLFLRFTNAYGEKFFYQNMGGNWPSTSAHPDCRLIDRTTGNASEARDFATVEDARVVRVKTAMGKGWEIVDGDGVLIE